MTEVSITALGDDTPSVVPTGDEASVEVGTAGVYVGGLDATGQAEGHVPTAQGDDTWAWAAAGGGGGMVGTGSPEGVRAAGVGTIYTDLDATSGAIRWIKKSGTGPTGWSVLYGDTGIRRITAAASEISGSYIRFRRVGDIVTAAVAGMANYPSGTPVNTSGYLIGTLPDFRPALMRLTIAPMAYEAAAQAAARVLVEEFDGSVKLVVPTAWDEWGWASFAVTWYTNQPWPQTLPGVAD